ncbi:MAG: peptidoglycan DD-metalloendopeptidase family protein [Oscillospiraceae bacterium]|nr:peptidoglycan DD-metalloendopeptidase family protein [Oscillospiraceae bacterium]
MMKNDSPLRSVLCVLLSVLLLIQAPVWPVRAEATTQDEIDAVKLKLSEIEKQIEAQQEVINQLTENKGRVVDRKIALDAKIDLTLQQIDLITEQVSIYDTIISEKETELAEAQTVEDTQSELLRARIRAMEENGNYSYISFLFEASSFSDLLSRLGDIDDIMHYDKALEERYMAAREDVETIKRSYEEYQLQQEDLVKELDAKKVELDGMIEAANQLMNSIDEMSDDAQAEYDAIKDVREQTEAELAALLKKLAEEEAAKRAAEAAAAAAAGGYGGSNAVSLSSLMWPVPSCSLITSRFGNRRSPTAGASSYHGGLDIGAGQGASIVAAQAGTVILASYSGGYGNCVMINHGNGLVTLYGHMQSISVRNGAHVSKGQTIGRVGSTGVSTGPHCHFEIRINGVQTDPAPYFSGLSYYNC